ncbi:hypothetical protein K7X08_027742 [Anisodus acutangulus]|uniref:Uncharacterized protein n=1 Tax=Anisodus acutangulus TaxID=402998 RepID=A0A9Q1LMB0_9SOLA|nr:hypothetical protein K7X08_027742 [Anisodus acutangulus]
MSCKHAKAVSSTSRSGNCIVQRVLQTIDLPENLLLQTSRWKVLKRLFVGPSLHMSAIKGNKDALMIVADFGADCFCTWPSKATVRRR